MGPISSLMERCQSIAGHWVQFYFGWALGVYMGATQHSDSTSVPEFNLCHRPGYTFTCVGQLFHAVSLLHFASLLCWFPCLIGICLFKGDVLKIPSSIFPYSELMLKSCSLRAYDDTQHLILNLQHRLKTYHLYQLYLKSLTILQIIS